jgi:dimethylargininase
MGLIALTRAVPESIAECELTHLERTPIDVSRARQQHAAYEASLRRLGCVLLHVVPAPDRPDSVFVEDTAVVLDEIAVIARPGAASRRPETDSVAEALSQLRPMARLAGPATLDGGDVLRIGRRIFVGLGGRTNEDGVAQLRRIASPHGYEVVAVSPRDCLHLKSAVTAVSDDAVILNPAWVDASVFAAYERIDVDEREPFAANVLRVNDNLICAAAADRTRERLEARGFSVVPVDVSELAKAEAGVTCCSIMVKTT